uniref:Uncharacterized protein n=1 Tax=Schistocephalus solidus TaxID=70667 RepID=A0A0V0J8I8_SCHSO
MVKAEIEVQNAARGGIEPATPLLQDQRLPNCTIASRLERRSKSLINWLQPKYQENYCGGCQTLASKLNQLEEEIRIMKKFIQQTLVSEDRLPESTHRITRSRARGNLHNKSPNIKNVVSKITVKSSDAEPPVTLKNKKKAKGKTTGTGTKNPKGMISNSPEKQSKVQNEIDQNITMNELNETRQIMINENSLQATRASSEANIEELLSTEWRTQSGPTVVIPPQAKDVEASIGEAPTSARQIIQQNPLDRGAVDRSQCIIVHGIRESTNEIPRCRINDDIMALQECLSEIIREDETIRVFKLFRLNSKDNTNLLRNKSRPLKVILENKLQRDLLIERTAGGVPGHRGIFFQQDYSVQERMKWRALKAELENLKDQGEKGLVIRNGVIVRIQKPLLWRTPIILKKVSRLSN